MFVFFTMMAVADDAISNDKKVGPGPTTVIVESPTLNGSSTRTIQQTRDTTNLFYIFVKIEKNSQKCIKAEDKGQCFVNEYSEQLQVLERTKKSKLLHLAKANNLNKINLEVTKLSLQNSAFTNTANLELKVTLKPKDGQEVEQQISLTPSLYATESDARFLPYLNQDVLWQAVGTAIDNFNHQKKPAKEEPIAQNMSAAEEPKVTKTEPKEEKQPKIDTSKAAIANNDKGAKKQNNIYNQKNVRVSEDLIQVDLIIENPNGSPVVPFDNEGTKSSIKKMLETFKSNSSLNDLSKLKSVKISVSIYPNHSNGIAELSGRVTIDEGQEAKLIVNDLNLRKVRFKNNSDRFIGEHRLAQYILGGLRKIECLHFDDCTKKDSTLAGLETVSNQLARVQESYTATDVNTNNGWLTKFREESITLGLLIKGNQRITSTKNFESVTSEPSLSQYHFVVPVRHLSDDNRFWAYLCKRMSNDLKNQIEIGVSRWYQKSISTEGSARDALNKSLIQNGCMIDKRVQKKFDLR